jgi:hypothetical protein
MNTSGLRVLAATLALAAFLPACSNAQRTSLLPPSAISQVAPPACHVSGAAALRKSQIVPAKDNGGVVVKSCTYKGDACECTYDMNDHPPVLVIVACIASAMPAEGVAVNGKLVYGGYGQNNAHGPIVAVFRNRKHVATLNGLTGDPIGLAVDPLGNVWATNSPSATISEFAKGSNKPTATYTDTNLTSASYLSVDAAGDVYVEGQADYSIEVDVLPAGGTSFTPIAQPGEVGFTAGGLAVQSSDRKTYVWINDQGSASSPATITRYLLKGSSLQSTGSFEYAGIIGAIWADPAGKNRSRVFADNNVVYGSEYASSAVEYAMPGGKIVNETSSSISSTEGVGIAGAFK